KVVNKFFYINEAGVAFGRMNYEMAFAIYLKVACPPVLHTIGLNDLFQCDVLHLSPSLHVIPCEEVRVIYKPFNLSDYHMRVKNFFLARVNNHGQYALTIDVRISYCGGSSFFRGAGDNRPWRRSYQAARILRKTANGI